ncbi:MAG: glycogen-debranching protein [Planctomycetota bacterium]|nr:MAG: glycogen-debranching protein [Planctomycetota bacterium]
MTAESDRASWEAVHGSPHPLGATWLPEHQAYNFAVYSKHAERVFLLLYDADQLEQPRLQFEFNYLRNKSGSVWHCRLTADQVGAAAFYAFQIDGPPPGPGWTYHAFDAEKVLLDPHAKAVYLPPGFSRRAAILPGSNAGKAPLGMLPHRPHAVPVAPRRGRVHHESDLVIYEMHVRGFTQRENSGVDAAHRGTFRGVVDKIPYLKKLGVTAVELMPVQQFDPQEGNYWGYMPLSFFAPHDGYSTGGEPCCQIAEFRAMVDALHAAGIEVIIDVVYNHTCEGNQLGPTYCYKGIDNTTYYLLTGDPQNPYANFSGTGNTLHTANRAVRRMILESLRYWAADGGVDGFRFDLASIFTRNSDGSINAEDPPIFGQIASEDDLADVRLIAEPWDLGTYQLGRNFPGSQWMQWNGAYRDTIQRFCRGDAGLVGEMMTRLYGSSDLFPDDRQHAYHPFQSINYVTSHDGFTLYDLVSYNRKNNWANGHNNTDGHNDFSWNCGWEGDLGVPAAVMQLRKRQVRNFFCLLMLSAGTPMFRMGDEFLQTQGGNNNPYNQDNETTWLDWGRLERYPDMFAFFRDMIAFRKQHPSIARWGFWRDAIRWFGTDRNVDFSFDSRVFAYFLDGSAEGDDDLYVMINMSTQQLRFGIHVGSPGQWLRVIDTSEERQDGFAAAEPVRIVDRFVDVPGRAVVVLVRPGG